jgi:hypothetical protein
MGQNTISYEANKVICEAAGCFEKATAKIELKVGHSRTISLNLCENCLHKFAAE